MSAFHLKIVTCDRLVFDGECESLVARTVCGDVCILARHTEYITPLGIGQIKVRTHEGVRIASCSGGTLMVTGGNADVIADTFEWKDEIDVERAQKAKEKAEERIANHDTEFELNMAEVKLKRAINRINTGRL